jgi:hypothetical protein
MVSSQPGQQNKTKQKSSQDPIAMEKSWLWWYVPVIPVVEGSIK